jgi:hypothetical protein
MRKYHYRVLRPDITLISTGFLQLLDVFWSLTSQCPRSATISDRYFLLLASRRRRQLSTYMFQVHYPRLTEMIFDNIIGTNDYLITSLGHHNSTSRSLSLYNLTLGRGVVSESHPRVVAPLLRFMYMFRGAIQLQQLQLQGLLVVANRKQGLTWRMYREMATSYSNTGTTQPD